MKQEERKEVLKDKASKERKKNLINQLTPGSPTPRSRSSSRSALNDFVRPGRKDTVESERATSRTSSRKEHIGSGKVRSKSYLA